MYKTEGSFKKLEILEKRIFCWTKWTRSVRQNERRNERFELNFNESIHFVPEYILYFELPPRGTSFFILTESYVEIIFHSLNGPEIPISNLYDFLISTFKSPLPPL